MQIRERLCIKSHLLSVAVPQQHRIQSYDKLTTKQSVSMIKTIYVHSILCVLKQLCADEIQKSAVIWCCAIHIYLYFPQAVSLKLQKV